MPRLLGVDIPSDKTTVFSLQYLYGVGPQIARELCHKAGVNPHVAGPRSARRRIGPPGGADGQGLCGRGAASPASCRRTFRGCAISTATAESAIAAGLPVRGQRTRTNARTRKGPKKTVAGKKGVKDMK